MTPTQKQHTVQQLADTLQNNHFYLANSQGLTSQEVHHIRHACHQAGIQYKIVKNTLLHKALQQLNNPHLDLTQLQTQALKGPTSIFILQENPNQPAHILQTFHKKHKQKIPTLKAAFVYDELYLGPQHLKALAQLKSKQELIAQLLQLLQAPTHNLLSALQTPSGNLTATLKTLAEKNQP